MEKIRVAVTDDSSFLRKAIVRMLSTEPRIEVVGTAATGEELLDRLDEWSPDVLTLDLSMPGMGGMRTLDHIMRIRPTPVIILSLHAREDAPLTIEALHRGAVDFIDKQRFSLVDFASFRNILLERIIEVGEGGRRHFGALPSPSPPDEPAVEPPRVAELPRSPVPPSDGDFRVVLVGASTGGPVAIQRVLEDLGADLPLPIIVVQHMPPGFTKAFADRLNSHLPLSVCEATDGERLLPGTVYIAPGGKHISIEERGRDLISVLSEEADDSLHRPSADRLFESAVLLGKKRVIAVVLTGMGSDGGAGMRKLAAAGAYTLAQDRETSVVYGMPRAAAEMGAAKEILPIDKIGMRLRDLLAPLPSGRVEESG